MGLVESNISGYPTHLKYTNIEMALSRSALRLLSSRISPAFQARGFADGTGMSLTFAAPTQVLYNNISVKQVDVPSFSGSFVSFQPMSLHWLFLNLVLLQYTKMMVVPRSSLFPAEL